MGIESQAYQDGYQARYASKLRMDNPHEKTNDQGNWFLGWDQANVDIPQGINRMPSAERKKKMPEPEIRDGKKFCPCCGATMKTTFAEMADRLISVGTRMRGVKDKDFDDAFRVFREEARRVHGHHAEWFHRGAYFIKLGHDPAGNPTVEFSKQGPPVVTIQDLKAPE